MVVYMHHKHVTHQTVNNKNNINDTAMRDINITLSNIRIIIIYPLVVAQLS
jgi:hypothetical protein